MLADLLASGFRRIAPASFGSVLDRIRIIRAKSLYQLGNQYLAEGNTAESVSYLSQAIQTAPHWPEAHNDLARALATFSDLPGAARHFKEALRLQPDFFPARLNLAMLYLESWQLEAAAEHLEFARKTSLHRPEVLQAQGVLYSRLGDAERAVQRHRRAAEIDSSAFCMGDYLFSLSYWGDSTPELVLSEHRRYADRLTEIQSKDFWEDRPLMPTNPKNDRLRVGYISPDFREHSVRYFFEPLIAHHDRARFQIHCYNDSLTCDEFTDSIRRRADAWRDIQGLPDRNVADLIAQDRIDILVELAGHTMGNRLSLLNHRVAPIQISALGYPPTTGLSTIDYKVSDPVADPEGADRFYSERLLRLLDCFWCFAPPDGDIETGVPPFMMNGFITFGCFGTLAKITPKMLETWAELLRRLPDARLLLKSGTLGQPYPDRFTRERLSAAGIDLHRVSLEGRSPGKEFPLAYRKVDIILDTFPCNGGTTTCFALWMGVPVVTLAGEILLSRMGASMLHLLGLDDLVAESFEDYAAIAERLARSPERIMELRQSLRPRIAASPLTDGARFTRNLETALEKIWLERLGTTVKSH